MFGEEAITIVAGVEILKLYGVRLADVNSFEILSRSNVQGRMDSSGSKSNSVLWDFKKMIIFVGKNKIPVKKKSMNISLNEFVAGFIKIRNCIY